MIRDMFRKAYNNDMTLYNKQRTNDALTVDDNVDQNITPKRRKQGRIKNKLNQFVSFS